MNEPVKSPVNDIWKRSTYRTGDGEVLGAVRPGSLDALALPSRLGDTLSYRPGQQARPEPKAPTHTARNTRTARKATQEATQEATQ